MLCTETLHYPCSKTPFVKKAASRGGRVLVRGGCHVVVAPRGLEGDFAIWVRDETSSLVREKS